MYIHCMAYVWYSHIYGYIHGFMDISMNIHIHGNHALEAASSVGHRDSDGYESRHSSCKWNKLDWRYSGIGHWNYSWIIQTSMHAAVWRFLCAGLSWVCFCDNFSRTLIATRNSWVVLSRLDLVDRRFQSKLCSAPMCRIHVNDVIIPA